MWFYYKEVIPYGYLLVNKFYGPGKIFKPDKLENYKYK